MKIAIYRNHFELSIGRRSRTIANFKDRSYYFILGVSLHRVWAEVSREGWRFYQIDGERFWSVRWPWVAIRDCWFWWRYDRELNRKKERQDVEAPAQDDSGRREPQC